MGQVYVVVATSGNEVESCEVFEKVQTALGRGFQLASNKSGPGRTDLFIHSPSEEFLQDGTIRWVFMDTNKQTVTVFGREVSASLPSQKDPVSFLGNLIPPPPYNFLDPSLPAGWMLNGQPATTQDLINGAFAVKDPLYDLTDNQKWALVEARIRKSPNYHSIPKGYSGTTTYQAKSLEEIRNRTQFGEQIRDGEIEALHALREDLIAGIISGTDHS